MKRNSILIVLLLLFSTIMEGNKIPSLWKVNELSVANESSLIINEIMVSNVDQYLSPSFNFDGWIELYNPSNESINLSGCYFSNSAQNLKFWKAPTTIGSVPPKGYLLIWFDDEAQSKNSVPFNLDVSGGTIFISNLNGEIITSQTYPEGMERISFARTLDGGNQWGYTSSPTPKSSNALTTYANVQIPEPYVDQPSQLFTGSLSINVEIPKGTTLRYTLDGSLPTLNNGQTSIDGKFKIASTTTYRFRLFSNNNLASRVTSRSYIYKDKNYTLPIISIVVDPVFLYDDSIGIYVKGVNGIAGNGQTDPCNWNRDWDRPGNFSYITNNEMVFNQDVNICVAGGYSRSWTPRTLKLKGNKELGGDKNLAYPFFSSKPYIRNRTLQVRNGGNDFNCRLTDIALQTMIMTSGIDIDCQSFQPCHEFINGQYMGMLNIREPNNKHYVYANYGWDDDEIDQFEIGSSTYIQHCGTDEAFNRLWSLSSNANDEDVYEEIKGILDIDEYINYMAEQFYLGTTEWPLHNLKGFRHIPDGKFRMVSFDVDLAFAIESVFEKFVSRKVVLEREQKMVTIFLNLLKNDEFRKKFIDTFCMMGGSVFYPERCNSIIDSIVSITKPALSLEGKSPESTANTLKEKLSTRMPLMTHYLKNFTTMGLTTVSEQNVILKSNIQGADILINDKRVPSGYFNGRLFAPQNIKAICPSNYKFLGWKEDLNTNNTIFNNGDYWAYYDKGSLQGKNWYSISYDTSSWKVAKAPFGYNVNGISTIISYGSDMNNKYITYYFRKNVLLDKEPDNNSYFILDFKVDDGLIAYVNGTEVGRYLMPRGNVSYSTTSSYYSFGNPDNSLLVIPGSAFHKGNNVIAIEVHNNSASSSDIYWDAKLVKNANFNSSDYLSTDLEISMPSTGNHSLTACYQQLSDEESNRDGIHPIMINEVSGSNSIYVNEYGKKNDWVELYNPTNSSIDIEGMFLTDDLSNPTKYQITKGNTNATTVIPSHNYLIIWCDKLSTTDRGLHSTFKIDGEGGVISLTSNDKSWADTLYYRAHDGNSTVGRYPDASNDVFIFNIPTIAKPNQISSYVIEQKNVLMGDVNGDGLVNISDVVCLINYILEKDNSVFIINAADLNSDEIINISDAVYLVNTILAK